MEHIYETNGVCSSRIIVKLNGNIIESVKIIGGCQGNTQGITKLVEGMEIDEVIKRLKGIQCGYRGTSCPDQLAIALEKIKMGEI